MPGCLAQLALPSLPFPVPCFFWLSLPPPSQALPFLSSSVLPPTLPPLTFVYPIVFLALPPSPPTTVNGPPGSPFLSELYLKVSFSGKPSLGTQLELQTPHFECPVPFAALSLFPLYFLLPIYMYFTG